MDLPQSGLDRSLLCDLCSDLNSAEILRLQNVQLQAQVEELESFARTVAHDIKGSLGSIVGFATVLRDDCARLAAEDQHKCLDSLVYGARKLSCIVDELLLLAEIRKTDVAMEPLYMASIVAEAQQRLASMIQDYGAEIVLPPGWPVAMGHGPWVEEIWINYLSNAIKYGGQPPRMELNAAAQLDGTVCFWVRDNGPGIALDDQARLFEPFTRLDRVRANGHGLGLSVVRHIVEKLGGEVGVCSAPGQGSVFSFTLRGCLPHIPLVRGCSGEGGSLIE
jgi:two-component system sensor histidine kinase/response regulator